MQTDRYHQAISACKADVAPEAVAAGLAKALENNAANEKPEVYRFLLSAIDLTTLSSEDSQRSVARFTEKVNAFDNDYPDLPHVAAICVYSNFAEVVKTTLDVEGVDIAVVAAGFPSSQTFTAVKVADVALAVEAGANEVDVVMNIGMLLDENYEDLCDELIELKHTARHAPLKVIIESGALRTPQLIRDASVLAMYSGADFIKTSTGKIYTGASLEAAYVMCQCIKEYYAVSGRKVGFKAAGGIRTAADAVKYYTVVKEVLGEEWLTPELFRIGASGLANSLLTAITGTETRYF